MRKSEKDNFPGGLLAIDKPCGMTSHDVVNKIRRLYNTARVGHTGTLDPLATGVLVLLVGRAAKACEYVSKDKKRYSATMRLGIETNTEDVTGNIISSSDHEKLPDADRVKAACGSFVGRIMQTPPMYSALKVDGKKLCDLARQGVVVERQSREIEIFSLECTPTDIATDYILDVACSGGTYIRTLCADIGKSLGCGAVMATLRRTEASGISIDDAHTLEEIEQMTEEEREQLLLPVETLFDDLPKVCLPPFFEKLCRDGCPIYQKKIKTDIPDGARVRLCDGQGEFFALGEAGAHPEGSAVKSVKIFRL